MYYSFGPFVRYYSYVCRLLYFGACTKFTAGYPVFAADLSSSFHDFGVYLADSLYTAGFECDCGSVSDYLDDQWFPAGYGEKFWIGGNDAHYRSDAGYGSRGGGIGLYLQEGPEAVGHGADR